MVGGRQRVQGADVTTGRVPGIHQDTTAPPVPLMLPRPSSPVALALVLPLGLAIGAGLLLGCSTPTDQVVVQPPAPPPPTEPSGWQRIPDNPVIRVQPTATTIDYACADPCALYDDGSGTWRIWYSSTWKDRASGTQRMVIRSGESLDGRTWTIHPDPAIEVTADLAAWDHTNVETPSVVRIGDRWLMAYSGGNTLTKTVGGGSGPTFPWYQIGLAESSDGRHFTRLGATGLSLTAAPVLRGVPGFDDGAIADPTLVYRDGALHLWCTSYGENAARAPVAYGISYARSTDGGSTWTVPHANPLASLYRPGDPAGGAQPSVLFDPAFNRFEMWFTNDRETETAALPTRFFTCTGFWHATSPDGITWTPDYTTRALTYHPTLATETYGVLTGVTVARHDGHDWMFYAAWGTDGIPDPSEYLVPLQNGTLTPAVISISLAKRPTPAVGWRMRPTPSLAVAVP